MTLMCHLFQRVRHAWHHFPLRFMGVTGLRGATKLRLTALSAFNPTHPTARPRVRRLALFDMSKRSHCM